MLSADISQSSCSNEWNVFRAKGIHLLHLNVSSLLPKIDEIQYIAAYTNAKYLDLNLMKPFFSQESRCLTMSCSDVVGTKSMEVLLAILEVI